MATEMPRETRGELFRDPKEEVGWGVAGVEVSKGIIKGLPKLQETLTFPEVQVTGGFHPAVRANTSALRVEVPIVQRVRPVGQHPVSSKSSTFVFIKLVHAAVVGSSINNTAIIVDRTRCPNGVR